MNNWDEAWKELYNCLFEIGVCDIWWTVMDAKEYTDIVYSLELQEWIFKKERKPGNDVVVALQFDGTLLSLKYP